MKKFILPLVVAIVAAFNSLQAQSQENVGRKEADIVEVVPTTKKDKLVLHKTEHFKKTMVEIRYSDNDYVGYVKMKKNKLEIDFSEVKPGTYTVVVLGKDNHIQEFHYTKE